MIDFVKLSKDIYIPESHLRQGLWRSYILKDGSDIRVHHYNGVWVRYYPESYRITISGKLLMLLEDSEVLNVDDVYGGDLPRFINDLNEYLNALFLYPVIDVSEFRVTRIDYCYNVKTTYVEEYLNFLNNAFRLTDTGQRMNYVQEKKLNGSVYIKTKSDYEHNERRNYVLNFYDKTDRLRFLKNNKKKHSISEYDWFHAQGVLRLEIQCGFRFIQQICSAFKIEPLFGNMLCYRLSYYAEKTIYERIFRCGITQDYYSYEAGKQLIPTKSKAARRALLHASQGHRITGNAYTYGCKIIKESGVYPFCFLPKGSGLDVLENPIRLIYRKLVEMGEADPELQNTIQKAL